LLAVAALAAVLYTWNITSLGPANFYLVAVKSMSVSWRAFFYGGLDPGATITIDKIPGAFYPQALSARVFGFHAWSVALPQIIEGIVAVLVLYRAAWRWQGPAVGLLAAGLFTATPIVASMFGQPMEDSLLIMCLVLAANAFGRALTQDRPGALVAAGVWIGIGFQAKMLEAWLVVPAFAVTYLVVARGGWARRLGHLAVAGAVMLAVSLSWVLLVTITPGHDRPYVDGSTGNSAFSMVFGYNGLDRFGIHVPGAVRPIVGSFASVGGLSQGWAKLVSGTYGTQVGWLYPLALLGLALGLARVRGAPRTDPARAGFIMWGLWAATFAIIYSSMQLPHTAYVATLAPPLAALSAAGIAAAWNGYRDGTARWALPAAIAAEAAWSVYLASRYPHFLPWLIWLIAAVSVVCATLLIAALTGRVRRTAVAGVMAAGVAAMIAAPMAWSASVLDPSYRGTAFDASAGPGGVRQPFSGATDASAIVPLSAAQAGLDSYLTARRGQAEFVAATESWLTAMPYIMATGQAFLPFGGFTGEVPYPAMATVRLLVSNGQLRYVLFGPGGSLSLAHLLLGLTRTPTSAVLDWVRRSCTYVPAAEYGGSFALGTLYRCGR
jgi:4-amino-4-deoxy-L-arabinose transferase-like glycosyltransferase